MKQKFLKKISAALMALLMTVSLFSEGLIAWADTIKNTQHTLYGWGYDFRGSGLGNAYDPLTGDYTNTAFRNKWASEFYYWKDANDNFAYCVQLGTSHVDSATMDTLTYDSKKMQTYYSDRTQKDNLKASTIYAYKGETKYGYDWETELVAAQTMTWIISGGYFDNSSEKLSSDENTIIKCVKAPSATDHSNLVECCKKLKGDILNHNKIPKGTSTNKIKAPNHKLTYNTATKKYEGTFTFDSSLSQFSFPKYDGVTFNVSGDTLTVTATAAGLEKLKSGPVTLTKIKAKNCDKIEECVPLFFSVQSGSSSQAKVGYMSGSDPVQAYAKFTADNPSLNIKKTFSSDGKTITATAAQNSSVTFKIYRAGINPTSYINAVKESDGVYVYSTESGVPTEYKVGADGDLTIKNLPINSALWIEETKTAPGYALAERTAAPVTTENAEYTIDNSKINFEVSKRDVAGNEIAGAVMQLIDEKGNTKLQWTSTQKPIIVSGLSAGKYTLRETYAPDGYTLATDIEITITDKGVIKADGVNVTAKSDDGRPLIVMVDKAISVEISKKAITGDDELPGAKLQIRDGETVVEEWISTDKPHIITGILKAGKTYTLHEEIAPDGYVVANDIQFTVNDDGTANVVEMKDDTTKVEIAKYDADTGKILSGAVLQILDGENVVEEWTSAEEPHVIEAKLIAGKEYVLHEVSAPENYLLSEDIPFTVSTDGRIDKIEMNDLEQRGSVEIRKVTEGMKNVEGIKFILSGTSDFGYEVSREETTDENGIALFEHLPVGTYAVTEDGETVPTAYITADGFDVTVKYNETAVKEVYNEEKTGSVQVRKTTEGNFNVEGITFILSGVSDSGREISFPQTTDENGIALWENVPIGTYTITEDGSTVPYGYLVAEPQEVTVKYAETVETEFINDEMTGEITVHKTTEGQFNVEGITFILSGTSDTGREISIPAVTDKDGIARFENIPVGTYTITEDGKTVPYGYLVADQQEVTVMYAETVDVKFLNQEMTGEVAVHKTTEGMRNVEGITFILSGTSDTGREISISAITDKDGIARFTNVPIGTYTITEDGKTVPYGYLVADQQEVTVMYAETVDPEFINKEQTGTVKIQKRTEGMTDISGIKFILKGTSETGREIKIETTTDEKGAATFENVPIGTYEIYEDGSSVPYGYLVADAQSVTVSNAETSNLTFENKKVPEEKQPEIPTTPNVNTGAQVGGTLSIITLSAAIMIMLSRKRKRED